MKFAQFYQKNMPHSLSEKGTLLRKNIYDHLILSKHPSDAT